MTAKLDWDFDNSDSTWTAISELHDDGMNHAWRITVCEDGTFTINESDDELLDTHPSCFDTLTAAKEYCTKREETLLKEAEEKPKPVFTRSYVLNKPLYAVLLNDGILVTSSNEVWVTFSKGEAESQAELHEGSMVVQYYLD